MESGTVKLRKPLPNTSRQVMPRFVVVPKLSQGGRDLGNPSKNVSRTTHNTHSGCAAVAVAQHAHYFKLSMTRTTTFTITITTTTTTTTSRSSTSFTTPPPSTLHQHPSRRTQTSFEPYSCFPPPYCLSNTASFCPCMGEIHVGPSRCVVHGPPYCPPSFLFNP
jgi:hypothetical protein